MTYSDLIHTMWKTAVYDQGAYAQAVADGIRALPEYRNMKSRANKPTNVASELAGPLTSAALLALVGAGIGARHAIVNNGNVVSGALNGAGIGAGVGISGTAIGSVIAAATRKRTAADQQTYDITTPIGANYVVPGVAAYNGLKRLGAQDNSAVTK